MRTNPVVIAELCITVGEGQAILRTDHNIEFLMIAPVSVKEVKEVISIVKSFISWKKKYNKKHGNH